MLQKMNLVIGVYYDDYYSSEILVGTGIERETKEKPKTRREK
jgi:hypothetical protein